MPIRTLSAPRPRRILDADAWHVEILGRDPIPDLPGGLGIPARFLETQSRIIAIARHAAVMFARPVANGRPFLGVHSELGRTCGRIEVPRY
jgi:hypothetical protein